MPGAPTKSTPLGIRAPRERNRSGYLRNSTTSSSSALASSTPATSAKVTPGRLGAAMRARLRPKLIVWLLLPWAWRIMNRIKPPKMIKGRKFKRSPNRLFRPLEPSKVTETPLGGPISTPLSTNRPMTSVSVPMRLYNRSLPTRLLTLGVMVSFLPSTAISRISPFLAIATTVVRGTSLLAPKLGRSV